MVRNETGAVLKGYRMLDRLGMAGDRTDGDLLDQFRSGSGDERELAFAALVERHGPMVQRVCRLALNDHHDAQDAAQAAFLALAIRARSIRSPGSLAAWLHGVALRVANHARNERARRWEIEQRAAQERNAPQVVTDLVETATFVHEAIDRLADRYKLVILACDLEGLSHAEAARRLRIPVRTLQTRLYRGRERLRLQLVRGGFTLSAVGLADVLRESSRAAVSLAWADATAQAAARLVEGSLALSAGLVSNRVLTWAGRLCWGHAMLRTTMAAVAISVLGLVLGGSLVLANRDGGKPQKAAEPPPPAKNQTAQPRPASRPHATGTIARPLPDPAELQRFLREVAGEAITLAREKPQPGSWLLAKIAQTQAKVGDRAGAADTFKAALEEASGGGVTATDAHGLWLIGQAQADAGMTQEARATFLKAAQLIPANANDVNKDAWTLFTQGQIIKYQVKVGDREHARENLKRLEGFVDDVIKTSRIRNSDQILLPELASVQAAAADFDGAFATVERLRKGRFGGTGRALGKITEGVEFLKPLEIRRFVRRAAEELEKNQDAADTYFALSDLAQAQGWLGDYQAARKTALAIGEGSSSANYDMTDGQPYALLCVALVQMRAGDVAGARETLRLGYESVQRHSRMRFPSDRLGQIAAGQIAAGDLKGALHCAEAVGRDRRATTLASAAVAQAMIGQPQLARATIEGALADARFASEHPPAPYVDRPNFASGTRVMPSSTDQLRRLAAIQAAAGDVESALATARSIPDESWRRWALGDVVQSRAKAGDLLEAFRVARTLESATDRRSALEKLADGLSERLDLEQGWKQVKAAEHKP